MMFRGFKSAFSKARLRLAIFSAAALSASHCISAATLTWNSTGSVPVNPADGSGTWNTTGLRWSTGTTNQPWVNGTNNAVIGHNTGAANATYTLTLGNNISAGTLSFVHAGTNVSYTLNGGVTANSSGYMLSTSGSWSINNANVVLSKGLFIDGSNPAALTPNLSNSGTLTLGGGAVFETPQFIGDSTGATPNNSNVYFNGGTLEPTVDGNTLLAQTGHAYIQTGGLTVDTSLVSNGSTQILDPLQGVSGVTDGGLILNGGGALYMGGHFNSTQIDPVFIYSGPTVVNNGVFVLDSTGGTVGLTGVKGPGPFPNTSYTIGSNGQVAVFANDALIGETGTGTVTINGGTLYAYTLTDSNNNSFPTSSYIGNTTLNGGLIGSDGQSAFEFLKNTELHTTSSATLSPDLLGFETGADIRTEPGVVLQVYSNLVDTVPPDGSSTLGQLTLAGSGSVDLLTSLGSNNVVGNTMHGPVTLNGGTLILDTANTATGMFPASPSITINNGATLLLGQSNTLIGILNGSTGVLVNPGGEVIAASGTTNHVANLTLNGGILASTGSANASGSYVFIPTSVLTVSANSTVSAQSVVLTGNAAVNVSFGSVLSVFGTLVDSSTTLKGQLTNAGPGSIQLYGANTFSGNTTISSGAIVLESGGALTKTPSIAVAAPASFVDLGTLGGLPAVQVNGSANFAQGSVMGVKTIALASLSVGASSNFSNGLVTLSSATAHANRLFLLTGGLTLAGTANAWTSKLDLSNNDMDVQHGNLATLSNQLKAGYNLGTGYWNGTHGIVSSSAASDTTYLTSLGVIPNSSNGTTPLYGAGTTLGLFDGFNASASDVLLKYTYVGDSNLDGKVDGSDYSRADNGFANTLTGWFNGDFNYDGSVNGSDYTLLDNAFDAQSSSLASQVASPAISVSNGSAVPEPASLAALVVAVGSLRRRSRN